MITDEHLAELKDLFVKHGVVLAYLFGSQAEGTARPSSDVDIAVLLPPGTPRAKYFDARLGLINDLAGALHRNDVDAVILNEATALLASEVVKHGKLLYEDDVTRPAIDFIVSTMTRYADTAHFRKIAWDYFSEAVEARRHLHSTAVLSEKTL